MTLQDHKRGALALLAADLVPPVLRRAMLEDQLFVESLGLVTDGTITFNPGGVTFRRSSLLRTVREASRAQTAEVDDEAGLAWTVIFDRSENVPLVVIKSGERVIPARHLGLLSADLNDRLSVLQAEAARVNLPASAVAHWSKLASECALSDNEVSHFSEDINNTPVAVAGAIFGRLDQESLPFDVLVPTSLEYYERLIGRWNGQSNIIEYADQVLPSFLEQLLGWNPNAGLRNAFLLAAHSLVIDRLASLSISRETFADVAQWAAREGDAMARCGVLELAVIRPDLSEGTKRELEENIACLIVPDQHEDEVFEMLSGAFVFVYGQLSLRQALADRPTFWRRMAAMAQAALIARCLVSKRGALVEFARDLRRSRSRPYAIQVCADMRLGPTWQAQFALLPQLRNEIVGRVISRAANREEVTLAVGLHSHLLGDETGSLKETIDLFLSFQAGPLEDNVLPVREMSVEDRAVIEAGLKETQPTARSFAALVNSVFLFRQTVEMADLAAESLSRAQYRLAAESNAIFQAALAGLATCAAVTRSIALADAVLMVLRYYRQSSAVELDIDTALGIGSIACAAWAEMPDWAAAMGRLMSDFAFHTLTKNEADVLQNYITDLCELVPELWSFCGPALAAAESLSTSPAYNDFVRSANVSAVG
jgi:hypothetical protein